MKTKYTMAVTEVSRVAFNALSLLDEKWKQLPDFDQRGNVLTELRVKGLLERRGSRGASEYRLTVPPNIIKLSSRVRTAKPKDANASQIPKRLTSPVSRGGYIPTYYTLNDFMNAVHQESMAVAQDRKARLDSELERLKQELPTCKGDDEYRVIQELARLSKEARSSTSSALIQAIRDVSSRPEFRSFPWDTIISTNPEDYEQ